jgi:Periplasmic binding protein
LKRIIRAGLVAGIAFGTLALPPPADAKDLVKVVFIGPLTGGVSANGLGGRNSADLAVRLRNQDENAKYEYEMMVLDDECKPNAGVQAATKAGADREVVAGVTHYCSAVAIATVDTYHRFGLPVVVWGAVLPDITYGNDYPEIHRVNGTMINQNEVAAELVTGLGYQTWVVFHDTTDYGKGHNKYFSEQLTARGGEILGTFGVTADQQDFTAELTQAKALNPDVIYFGGLTPLGIRIRQQMDRLGIDALFQGTSGMSPTPSSTGWGRSRKARSRFAKARRSRSCRADSSSWSSTRRRATASRPRPMARLPSPRWTSCSTPSRRSGRIGRRSSRRWPTSRTTTRSWVRSPSTITARMPCRSSPSTSPRTASGWSGRTASTRAASETSPASNRSRVPPVMPGSIRRQPALEHRVDRRFDGRDE